MIFWLVAAAMTALVVALLIAPLMRPRRDGAGGGAAADADATLAVYRDQLDEIERDLSAGVLTAEQADAARREVQRRLLAAADGARRARGTAQSEAAQEKAAGGPPQSWAQGWPALSVVVLVPAATLALYFVLGAPDTPSRPFAERPPAGNDLIDLTARADALARRLVEEDGPAEDWALLARTLAQLERFPQAAEAIRQAIAKGLDGPQARTFLGEVLVAANQGRVVQEAREAFAWVLEREPANPFAIYYAGLALAQDGHTQQAFNLWVTLARASPPGSPWLAPLRQQITAAAQDLGVPVPDLTAAAGTAAPPDSGQGSPSQSGPSQADVDAAADMTPEEREAFIQSMVARLAERLEETPDDLQGWLRLARAYVVLGDTEKARAAVARARPLVEALPEDAPERGALKALADSLGQ